MANSYLDIAQAILRRVKAPLSAKEILAHAYLQRIVPHQLFGKTPQKTLGARLSEDIRKNGAKSQFYRTKPGLFFLRELLDRPGTPDTFKRVYEAPRRAKQLGRERVLILRTKPTLAGSSPVVPSENVFPLIDQGHGTYLSKRRADREPAAVQIIAYVIVRREEQVLASRVRGNRPSRERTSVGFRGNLTDHDVDLFNQDEYGLINAGLRVLHEEVGISTRLGEAARTKHLLHFRHFLQVTDCEPAFRHLAAVISYRAPPEFVPTRNVARLFWMDLRLLPNDLSDFDPWSKVLLEQYRQSCSF